MRLSVADVVGMAIEVLKECQVGGGGGGTGTGGKNVFEGGWRVSVSREVIRARIGIGGWGRAGVGSERGGGSGLGVA